MRDVLVQALYRKRDGSKLERASSGLLMRAERPL